MKSLACTTLFCLVSTLSAQAFATMEAKQIVIPVQSTFEGKALNYNLNARLYYNTEVNNAALAVLSHGSGAKSPSAVFDSLDSQARWFAQRGFMTLVVERRGYGGSTENMSEKGGECDSRNYNKSGQSASRDILGAINYLKTSEYKFDQSRVLLVGRSSGGFSSVYAGGLDPSIKAVISFAGGRGADEKNGSICSQDNLMKVLQKSGKDYAGNGQSVPNTLWVFAENDKSFPPAIAKAMFEAFQAGGGKGQFVAASSFQADGHNLFSGAGQSIWTGMVEKFLTEIGF
ncbi:MAG: alpha/beta hydrolase family protein [Bdellovibrionales bacterium]